MNQSIFLGGIALEVDPLAEGVALARIVDQQREGAAVDSGAGALAGFM
jgi:hypothetical protein